MDEVKPQNNEGLKTRHELTKNSKMFEVMGPIHSDFFNQDRFLLNNVELRIKLTRQRDPFVLMSTFQNEKLLILDATLLVRKVRISPSVLLGHAAALEKAPANYPLTRVDLKTITIPAGLQDKTISNLHSDKFKKD
ncbi:N-acetylmuramic acid 6-phosphate etherase [Frankliniella fusca]|uniref:N-acetylmuramic acid 6-phosphate etherase n=1 Tax=Frankliniella fusca TaxID=407009 RepID=A0AAE1LV49_9NEOP|nr:N-acetylmuramic acid 6-phosphate etherase [Frankliniella fusca]